MTDSNDGEVTKPKPFSKEQEYQITSDCKFTVGWDQELEEILFEVEMPSDAYLAVAFGENQDRDMILFNSAMQKPT